MTALHGRDPSATLLRLPGAFATSHHSHLDVVGRQRAQPARGCAGQGLDAGSSAVNAEGKCPTGGQPDRQADPDSCGLLALPDPLLHEVTQRAGRPSRTLCRALATSYGPLKLELTDIPAPTTHTPHLPLYLHSPHHSPSITQLTLRRWPCSLLPHRATTLAAIAAKFPALTTLSLPAITPDTPLAPLAPLAPTLTSLSLTLTPPHHTAPPPSITPISSLTALHALTVHYHHPPSSTMLLHTWPPLLPSLPHLTHLHVSQGRHTLANPGAVGCSPWVIAVAEAAPQLVSFCINATPQGWGPDTMAALRTLSRLRTLQVALRTELSDDVRSFIAAWAAGPRLPRASLVASVHVDGVAGALALEQLGQLRGVGHLEVTAVDSNFIDPPGCARPEVEALWQAIAPQPHLSRLALKSPFSTLATDLISGISTLPSRTRHPPPLADLAIEAHTFDPPALLPPLARLPALLSLRLTRWSADAPWPAGAVSVLGLLTSLTCLHLTDCDLAPGMLRCIGSLTCLRHLSLCENQDPATLLLHPHPLHLPPPPAIPATSPTVAPQPPALTPPTPTHPTPNRAPTQDPLDPSSPPPPVTSTAPPPPDAPPQTSELWHLAGLHRSLTHLSLDCVAAAFSDGLAVIPQLTALQHLTLAHLPPPPRCYPPAPAPKPPPADLLQHWHRLLLPLPTRLATLALCKVMLTAQGRNELADATRRADCRLALEHVHTCDTL